MKRYFVWKDANCNGINPEWLEISGEDFAQLKKENPQRRFIPCYNEDDPEDGDCFLYEATKENYNEWNRDQMRYHYRDTVFHRKYKFVSLDDLVSEDDEEGLTWAEIIPDTSEEDAEAHEAWLEWHDKAITALREALAELKPKELEIVNLIFLNNPDEKSEVVLSKEKNIPQQTLNYRKNAVLKKLRKIMAEKLGRK